MATNETRDRILDAAARLFHEQGYNATGIATILREADVNSGSLYHFFPSKEDLLRAVLERYVDLLKPVVMSPAEQMTDDPIERVFALLEWYRTGLEMTRCTLGCPIGNLALEVGDSHPEVRGLIDLNFANWATAVRSWLEAAEDRLPESTDLDGLARFILTVMEGAIMQSRAAGNLAPFDKSVIQLRDYFNHLEAAAKSGAPRARKTARRS